MNDVTTALAILGGLLGVVAILAVCFVYFRGVADKATIESQGRLLATRKDEIDDLTRRVQHLEVENAEQARSLAQVRGIDQVQATANAIKADTAAIRTKVGAA